MNNVSTLVKYFCKLKAKYVLCLLIKYENPSIVEKIVYDKTVF